MAVYKQKYRRKGKQMVSKVWWYEFVFNGQRIRESSKSTSKKVAIAAERAHRRRLEEGHNGIKKAEPPKTFGAAAKDFFEDWGPTLSETTLAIHKREVGHLLPLRSSHVAWRLYHGYWPKGGTSLCHACDNPACVNPLHLYEGDAAANGWDRFAKHNGGILQACSPPDPSSDDKHEAELARFLHALFSAIGSGRRAKQ